jgi:hypothetical protein
MFDCVLAFGNSHVAGFEITTPTPERGDMYMKGELSLEDLDSYNKHLAFPNIVAEHLEIPCYNYALTGGSNERSMRLLPNALLDHPNSLVLFCYAALDRNEIYYPDNDNTLGKDSDNYLQLGMQWYKGNHVPIDFKYLQKQYPSKNPINTYYVENMLHPEADNIKACNQMFYVEQACKNYATGFRHLFLEKLFYNTDIPRILSQALSKDKIISFNGCEDNLGYGSYYEFGCNNFVRKEYGHFGIEAHQAVADLIINTLY